MSALFLPPSRLGGGCTPALKGGSRRQSNAPSAIRLGGFGFCSPLIILQNTSCRRLRPASLSWRCVGRKPQLGTVARNGRGPTAAAFPLSLASSSPSRRPSPAGQPSVSGSQNLRLPSEGSFRTTAPLFADRLTADSLSRGRESIRGSQRWGSPGGSRRERAEWPRHERSAETFGRSSAGALAFGAILRGQGAILRHEVDVQPPAA